MFFLTKIFFKQKFFFGPKFYMDQKFFERKFFWTKYLFLLHIQNQSLFQAEHFRPNKSCFQFILHILTNIHLQNHQRWIITE